VSVCVRVCVFPVFLCVYVCFRIMHARYYLGSYGSHFIGFF